MSDAAWWLWALLWFILGYIANNVDRLLAKSRSTTFFENDDMCQYEVFFKSTDTDTIKIEGWFPIPNERIRHPEKIQEYIKAGILRKNEKENTRRGA